MYRVLLGICCFGVVACTVKSVWLRSVVAGTAMFVWCVAAIAASVLCVHLCTAMHLHGRQCMMPLLSTSCLQCARRTVQSLWSKAHTAGRVLLGPNPPLYYTEGRVCLHVLWHIRRSQCCSVSLVGDAVTRQWRSCLLCQCLSCGRACLACAEQQVGVVNPCNGQVGYHHCWQHV